MGRRNLKNWYEWVCPRCGNTVGTPKLKEPPLCHNQSHGSRVEVMVENQNPPEYED